MLAEESFATHMSMFVAGLVSRAELAPPAPGVPLFRLVFLPFAPPTELSTSEAHPDFQAKAAFVGHLKGRKTH